MNINVSEIDRIEVVPGASSALYGSEAVGGVINVLTKMPTKEEYRLRYLRGFNDAERNIAEASYRNRWENGLAVILAAGYEDMAGFAANNPVILQVTGAGNGRNARLGSRRSRRDAFARRLRQRQAVLCAGRKITFLCQLCAPEVVCWLQRLPQLPDA